ncbi:MAG: polysaccharide deacetylase family protein [Acidobacteria bacterium]|nr:polysaccharide deacetylase family protein [Acidobacteriota bacterium]
MSRHCLCMMLLVFSLRLPASSTQAAADRQVAITIDDLPGIGAESMTAAALTEMTSKILAALRQDNAPAVGFVNEVKLYKRGEVDARMQALNLWLDSGFELGNHTFKHTSLNRSGLEAWEDDVIQGEPVIRMLLAQHKMKLRYFRHPYLDTGADLETRRKAEAFLSRRGYLVAPVTVDAWDWNFAGVYEDAKKRGDNNLLEEVVRLFLSYHDAVFAYCEQLSRDVVGYEPRQVLLLHGSQLEADHLGELLQLIRKRGYRFITLEQALLDPAYSLPDTYVSIEGRGWLEHWAITKGKPPQGAPEFPPQIAERTKALRGY